MKNNPTTEEAWNAYMRAAGQANIARLGGAPHDELIRLHVASFDAFRAYQATKPAKKRKA